MRTRNGVGDSRLKQSQQELERRLLELEGIVYPELYENEVSANNSLSTGNMDKLCEEIRYGMKELENLIPSERDPAKRELSRKRLEASSQRLIELETQGKARGASWAIRARQARERELLFGNRNAADFDPEAADEISAVVIQNESLKHSNRGVDEILDVGKAILSSLSSQSETIKRATDKVETVANTLGLSNSLLRAVRRRQFGDSMIVYGGMFTVTLILYLFYRWLH